MTDRPILFSAPMVRAILQGRKTMTRRILKPQPPRRDHYGRDIMDWGLSGIYHDEQNSSPSRWWLDVQTDVDDNSHTEIDIRFAPGDHLWVREAWRASYGTDWRREDLGRPPKPSELDVGSAIEYLADETRELSGKNRPGIFLPRWASRLTLLVEAVRVERLQDISRDDVIAEGIAERDGCPFADVVAGWHEPFAALWDSINGRGTWAANPWVSVTTFRPILANIDAIPTELAA